VDDEQASTGAGGLFGTTHWSLVVAAGDSHHPGARQALERLCETYWYPVYVLIRCRGNDAERSRDLAQGFFLHLLERQTLKVARPEIGRFRAFLKTVLRHYLTNERVREEASKRGGTGTRLRIDFAEAEAQYRHESGSDDPESMYEKRWARTVLSRALDRLRAELYESGSPDRWRRLEPFLTGNAAPGRYREIAEALEMTESGVKVAVHRLRKRYGEALRSEVSQTVNSPQDVDDEVRHLLKVVGP
jgi:RNA polymerase sigma-70 factor (ECF subfamily)